MSLQVCVEGGHCEAGLRQGYEGDTGRGKPLTWDLGRPSCCLGQETSAQPMDKAKTARDNVRLPRHLRQGQAVLTWATRNCDLEFN